MMRSVSVSGCQKSFPTCASAQITLFQNTLGSVIPCPVDFADPGLTLHVTGVLTGSTVKSPALPGQISTNAGTTFKVPLLRSSHLTL
jgi:hypothetical protein